MKNLKTLCMSLMAIMTSFLLFNCQPDDAEEQLLSQTSAARSSSFSRSGIEQLTVVTYNIHGGHGDLYRNLSRFRDEFLEGTEHALCLQEVKPGQIDEIRRIFSAYPYYHFTQQEGTKFRWPWEPKKILYNLIITKLPIVQSHTQLIQVDPGGDKWQRKSHHLLLECDVHAGSYVHLFHYHNTYNWNYDDFEWERRGIRRWKDYVNGQVPGGMEGDERWITAGDYNIFPHQVSDIFPNTQYYGSGRDHQNANVTMVSTKTLFTRAANISDHDAIWVRYDIPISLSTASALR